MIIKLTRTMAILGVLWLSGASLGCHRAGVALGEALRNRGNYPPTLQSGYYPDEIACIYEGWPLYFRQRYVAASGGYVCVYAGHGHTGTIACD